MGSVGSGLISFTFPGSVGLEKVRTGIFLDSRGAKLTVVGVVPCHCRGSQSSPSHEIKVVIQYVMKGRGNEDRLRLGLVERMIRGSCPLRQQDAEEAAMIMTTLLVNDHLNRHNDCKGVVTNGEAAKPG